MTACTYCRRPMDRPGSKTLLERTADHIMPAWLRRKRMDLSFDEAYQTVPCCWHCNQLKGQKSAEQWESFMAANPRWWEKPEFQRRRMRYDEELTAEQIAYLHEIADEERKRWTEFAATLSAGRGKQ